MAVIHITIIVFISAGFPVIAELVLTQRKLQIGSAAAGRKDYSGRTGWILSGSLVTFNQDCHPPGASVIETNRSGLDLDTSGLSLPRPGILIRQIRTLLHLVWSGISLTGFVSCRFSGIERADSQRTDRKITIGRLQDGGGIRDAGQIVGDISPGDDIGARNVLVLSC
jgi:hypothetical protein